MDSRVAEGTFSCCVDRPTKAGVGRYFIFPHVLPILLVAASAALCWGTPQAEAVEDRTTDVAVSTYANYETVSVYGNFAGDDNANGLASFEYKKASSGTWLPGMPMDRIPNEARFAAFFFAEPNAAYDVHVTFNDPDGLLGSNPVQVSVTTRTDTIPVGSGRIYYVSPNGDDSDPGTSVEPFRTISKAASVVVPGDTVYVKAGTYRERVNLIGKSGTPANWITFQAFGDGPAILDGSDRNLVRTGQNRWSVYSGSVYQASLSYTPQSYLAIDGLRAYHYPTLSSLVTGIAGIPAGWFYDGNVDVLYLKTKDGSDPDLHAVQVARQRHGFELGNSHYMRIKGFTLQYYGEAGIRFNGGESDIVIEGNTIQNNNHGIRKGGAGGSNYTIQDNTISDTEVWTWPWNRVKKTEHEAAGIALFAMDRGAVIRGNTVQGYFDGVQLNYWPPGLGYNSDSDIYNNSFSDCGDDGTELEGSNQTNVRFWGNTMRRCFVAMSVIPVLRGPVYLFRNSAFQTIEEGFKIGSSNGGASAGVVRAYHNTIHAIDDVGNDDDGVQCINNLNYLNHTYRNNVFYVGRYVLTHEGCTSTGTTYDYDLMYTKDTARFVKWDSQALYRTLGEFQAATGQALHSIQAVPQFEDLNTGDLRLASTSPGVDAGVVLVGFNDADSLWPYAGGLPDLGAFEVGTPVPPILNQPPVLAPIGDRIVKVGSLLTFTVNAADADGDSLIYSIANLPAGATLTGLTFSWRPSTGQVGAYPVTFTVSDGEFSDSETITITVTDGPVVILSLTDDTDPFSPNRDGRKDTTTIRASFNHTVSWKLQIKKDSGSLVRTFTGSGTTLEQPWDGETDSGASLSNGTYTYVLTATDAAGSQASKSGTVKVDTVAPSLSGLSDSPDPFTPQSGQTTTISFTISELAYVTLGIYTKQGSLIRTLLANQPKTKGTYRVTWDGKDGTGAYVPTGTYYYKVWVEDPAGNRASSYPASRDVRVE